MAGNNRRPGNGTNFSFTSNRSFSSSSRNGTNFSFTGNASFTSSSRNGSNFSFFANGTNFGFSSNRSFTVLNPVSLSGTIKNSEVKTIYDNLNLTYQQYGMNTVTIPNYQDSMIQTNHINNLKSLIDAMQSNTHIASNASTSHITIPQAGEKIVINPYIELNEVIIKAHDNCISFS